MCACLESNTRGLNRDGQRRELSTGRQALFRALNGHRACELQTMRFQSFVLLHTLYGESDVLLWR